MGLGLNGGGLESARYLALQGAECTITDTKDHKALALSIEILQNLTEPHTPFRYVLGKHEIDDFTKADMVIKNPAVRPDSPWLAAARRIETDISLFLAASPARLSAITGTKGKSIISSAVHWVLGKAREAGLLGGSSYLGGNIAVSPLTFIDKLTAADDVVLELSSFQLGDLKGRNLEANPDTFILKPRAAIITGIMPDHQDRYGNMETYVNDKRLIYQGQDKDDITIACADDSWGQSFLRESPGRTLPFSAHPLPAGQAGAWIDPHSGAGLIRGALSNGANYDGEEIVPPQLLVPGRHQKKNSLAAALALFDLGLPIALIRESLSEFPGIGHRLEFFREINGIHFYNDTAATIPEAAAAAVEAFCENPSISDNTKQDNTKAPLILVCGGTDKELDFSPLFTAIQTALTNSRTLKLVLLEGTGSVKLIKLLTQAGITFKGPYDNIQKAAKTAMDLALEISGTEKPYGTVVLSPGCASFGMFANEFDRGWQWKEAVNSL